LEWVEQASFIQDLNELLRPIPIKIGLDDRWMPLGRREPREARLETFGPKVVPEPHLWESLRRWWLAHGGNTPNWDLASACTLEERRGLLGDSHYLRRIGGVTSLFNIQRGDSDCEWALTCRLF
jgi:hypothetical protein